MKRNCISACLILLAIVIIGDDPLTIALAAGMIAAAGIIQGRERHGKASRTH